MLNSLNDIMELVSSLSKSSVENVLKKLTQEKYIERRGKGKSTFSKHRMKLCGAFLFATRECSASFRQLFTSKNCPGKQRFFESRCVYEKRLFSVYGKL